MGMEKSTVEEIRRRFDAEVERFSNLETGQSATIDSPLAMTLVAETAAAVTPQARDLLDVGCGAGNYSLKLLQYLPDLNVTLVDLSQAMLDRAVTRVTPQTAGRVAAIQSDLRDLKLKPQSQDVILASAVLHHLRTDEEWIAVFRSFFQALRPGGSFWIFDLIEHSLPQVQSVQWRRYGEYLTGLKNTEYRDAVFSYIAQEDTPKPLLFQLDQLRAAGFAAVDVLHKNCCFAAFGGVKAAD